MIQGMADVMDSGHSGLPHSYPWLQGS